MLKDARSYRCFYTPTNARGFAQPSESGVLPFIQLRAENGEQAQRAAHHVTGCPVESVERIEACAA